MSGGGAFEPKIVAFVCNWCTYLGADLAGTNRLEYPPNVRIIRLPCTGRIDFNLIVKALEMRADAVLVSGCHPGDCHYASANYHARRRWMLFRPLLDTLGYDLRRIHFAWISAAEGKKFQQVITRITDQTRQLGPYRPFDGAPPAPQSSPVQPTEPPPPEGEEAMRQAVRRLIESGDAKVVLGCGEAGQPALITRAEDAGKLCWNGRRGVNPVAYLKRKEVRALGAPAVVAGPDGQRALVVLEQESQVAPGEVHVIPMPEDSAGQGQVWARLDAFMEQSPEQRLAYWRGEFDRCFKCYACRQVCPLCYCERCIVDKNRPQAIDTSATEEGNFAWHVTRAFHLAGRCVGCGACARACPAGIALGLLNMSVAKAAWEAFGYRAGEDRNAGPPIGSYSLRDKEGFIR